MKTSKLSWAALAAAAVVMIAGPAQASAADFTIFDGTKTSPVLIDAGYGGAHDDRDYRQLRRAVQDLRQDVAMVTGAIDGDPVRGLFVDDEPAQAARLAGADPSKVPALITAPGNRASAIMVGEIEESDLIDGIDRGQASSTRPPSSRAGGSARGQADRRPAARHRQRARDRGQRRTRDDLRDLLAVGADRRLPLVLVQQTSRSSAGRRSRSTARSASTPARTSSTAASSSTTKSARSSGRS